MAIAAKLDQLSWFADEPKKPARVAEAPDPLRWIRHVATCTPCALARQVLLEFRTKGRVDPDVVVPVACGAGLAMMEMEDLVLLIGRAGLTRDWASAALRRLTKHADTLSGRSYVNTHLGVAWNGGPILSSDRSANERA